MNDPAVDGTDNVRVLVRGEDVVHVADVHVARSGHRQWGISQVAARIDQCFVFAVDNQELVGLDALAGYQGIEHQAFVVSVIEQDNRLGCHFGLPLNTVWSGRNGRILQAARRLQN